MEGNRLADLAAKAGISKSLDSLANVVLDNHLALDQLLQNKRGV